jgi:hypothetical protein
MTTRGDRSALARYIDLLAGADTPHSKIAAAINEANPGARVAGPLVSRWRSQQLDVSPGNLAALARAYGRSPLEAFVIVGLLDKSEAEGGLDAGSSAVIDYVWRDDVDIVLDLDNLLAGEADELKKRRQKRRPKPNVAVDEAARGKDD